MQGTGHKVVFLGGGGGIEGWVNRVMNFLSHNRAGS